MTLVEQVVISLQVSSLFCHSYLLNNAFLFFFSLKFDSSASHRQDENILRWLLPFVSPERREQITQLMEVCILMENVEAKRCRRQEGVRIRMTQRLQGKYTVIFQKYDWNPNSQ
jgi:hypothetical protein